MLFSGYYKDEATTNEVMDHEGFFHTGDIGELDTYRQLHIIDRKKSLFKLSQGMQGEGRARQKKGAGRGAPRG